MGELGRRFAGKGAGELKARLSTALADEWAGHYNYWLASRLIRGHRSPDLETLLQARSEACFVRAGRLAARLEELGGVPPLKLGALLQTASPKPFKLPKDLSDADALLRAVLDAERTSAGTFEELARAEDIATRRLAEDLLAESLAVEQQLERLLGRAAPEMDGR